MNFNKSLQNSYNNFKLFSLKPFPSNSTLNPQIESSHVQLIGYSRALKQCKTSNGFNLNIKLNEI